MKIISIINWKGGVGKTTITHHIATCLQELELSEIETYTGLKRFPKVLLIDLDPQCNLSISALGDTQFEQKAYLSNSKTIRDLIMSSLDEKLDTVNIDDYILKEHVRSNTGKVYKHVDLIMSHQDLIYTDMDIAVTQKSNFKKNLINSGIYKFQIIDSIIQKVHDQYDFVLIDCPPNLNYITQNAIYTSQYYLIPTILDKLSSYGILSIKNKVDELNEMFGSLAKEYIETNMVGIVANNVRDYLGPKMSQYNVLQRLGRTFPNLVFKNYLTNGDGIAKASGNSYPVFSLEKKHPNAAKQANAIRNITKEFLTKLL